MTESEWGKALRKARKAAKECTVCGRQDERTLSGRALCEVCANKNLEHRKNRYHAMREARVCVVCGEQDQRTYAGWALCERCKDLRNEYGAKYREGHREKILGQQRAYAIKRDARLKEVGLCSRCGKNPPLPGKRM